MQRINVLPNPFIARDKFGRPCAVCPRDPDQDSGGGAKFVGAKVDQAATVVTQKLRRGDDMRSAQQRTFYKYLGIASDDPELAAKLAAAEPVNIPLTRYYRDRLREGALIVADKASAEVARVKFHEPLDVFPKPAPAPVPEAPAESDEDSDEDDGSDEGQ